MNKPYDFRESENGTFSVMIDCCSNSVLSRLLNPKIQYVWSVNHFLEDHYDWSSRQINLSKDGPLHTVLVRDLSYDFIMDTKEYLGILNEFERQGNILIQCTQTIPQSLQYWKLPEEQRTRILVQNGMYSEFFLPHENETASFQCVDRTFVEAVIKQLEQEDGQQNI